MSQKPREDSSRLDEKRLQQFLDCIAHLMARRWLRDQRQKDEKPPQGIRKSKHKEV